ncbi:hypothetical protein [Paralysiella testudinis]|uniref:Uncharacterized protein n=1 Tax=Paralysiella testudinis TaxID=2809020 RepID=A0A892ZK63_9NEIS|nr:hypothetical protein [Paralysiella testudinis]QRQ82850.1 hypothetical protein JQU52_05575 [Paralysiella testudinis]
MIPTPIAMAALMQTLAPPQIEQQRPQFEAAFFTGEWQMPLGDDAESTADRQYRRQSLHYRLAFAGWLACAVAGGKLHPAQATAAPLPPKKPDCAIRARALAAAGVVYKPAE